MFEAAELGRKVSKQDYDAAEPQLHTDLLEVQRAVARAKFPVIIIVSGVEGAGKGTVVNRINTWLDARWVRTHAFWDETEEETQRPRYWRFWQKLPPAGTIGILFGSWYTKPIVDRVFRRIGRANYEHELRRIAEFEHLLAEDGALIVKFWFHLSEKQQQKRLRADLDEGLISSPLLKKFSKRYPDFLEMSERAIRLTDTGPNPWHIIESGDRRFRDLTVGQTLLQALRHRLAAVAEPEAAPDSPGTPATPAAAEPRAAEPAELSVLDRVDLDTTLPVEQYDKLLRRYQRKLNKLAWQAREQKRHTIALFEGWDAAGKGGAIRRITQAIDARLYQVISVAAPTDEERAQHYLWRFWRHLPRGGAMTFYDRSWYGRVLVERVEQFAQRHEWQRAYQEINDFEEQLVEHGVVLLKFWLHISNEEQLRRFREREQVAWKKHKITAEDWRNREKWPAYTAAVNEMVERTSTEFAPWSLIAGNDKKVARIEVLRTLCQRLERAMK